MESAWYYEIDGQQIDSERCCCFTKPSPHCPIHSKNPDARPLPKKGIMATGGSPQRNWRDRFNE